jgi:hypothetical protein
MNMKSIRKKELAGEKKARMGTGGGHFRNTGSGPFD